MGERAPLLYCPVCHLLVVMNILGMVTRHNPNGVSDKKVSCAGSDQPGTLYTG